MRRFGPGFLVTAAFIGPGTIVTCSRAGALFGYSLIWALLFSVLTTLILQDMSARLGMATGKGLGEAIRTYFPYPILAMILIIVAITFGNIAFETGNLLGATASIATGPRYLWTLLAALIAALVLASGTYRVILSVLMALVAMMSIIYFITAFMVGIEWMPFWNALVHPQIPKGSLINILALIGTTVVPYNLFLHANAVKEQDPDYVRYDSVLAISIGGVISLAILITATPLSSLENVAEISKQLEPLLGPLAPYLLACGLLAAGLSSAITAPLATAYATCGTLGWSTDLKNTRFRVIWFSIILIGAILACLEYKPLKIIVIAQAANGLLLPLTSLFLIWAANQSKIMADKTNGILLNIFALAAIAIIIVLSIYEVFL